MRSPFSSRRRAASASRLTLFGSGALFGAGLTLAAVTLGRPARARRRLRAAHLAGPMTPATLDLHAADAVMGVPGVNDDERLDEALQETFPTSDPVSITVG